VQALQQGLMGHQKESGLLLNLERMQCHLLFWLQELSLEKRLFFCGWQRYCYPV
jgi:hypothetical protein